jgi:predicted nucleic acid-binding protein
VSQGLTLDTGALIAFERGNRHVVGLLARSRELRLGVAVPAGVVAQVWRDGRRQARLAHLLGSEHVEVELLDDKRARAAGQLCGVARTADIVDASVVLCARSRDHALVTSDPKDLRRLDASLSLIAV